MRNIKYSFSSLNLYNSCRYAYYLKYIKNINPFNPNIDYLLAGSIIHEAIEKGEKETYLKYFNNKQFSDPFVLIKALEDLPVICDLVKDIKAQREVRVETDELVGIIDEVIEENGEITLCDYKYTRSNGRKYSYSGQLEFYAYLYEKSTGKKPNNLIYKIFNGKNIKEYRASGDINKLFETVEKIKQETWDDLKKCNGYFCDYCKIGDLMILKQLHENSESEFFGKNATKYTQIKPVLKQKQESKLSGICDAVGRMFKDEMGNRFIDFKGDCLTKTLIRGDRVEMIIPADFEEFKKWYKTKKGGDK